MLLPWAALTTAQSGQGSPTCLDFVGRTELVSQGAFCYQLHNERFNVPGQCSEHYIITTSVPGGRRLCVWDESTMQCRTSEVVNCLEWDRLTMGRSNILDAV